MSDQAKLLNTNDGLLIGFRCPKCGQFERFEVCAEAFFSVTDCDARLSGGGIEWNDGSWCRCHECDHVGTVGEFKNADDAWNCAHEGGDE